MVAAYKRIEKISIHSAIASGDEQCCYHKPHSVISIHSAIASGDTHEFANAPEAAKFQSTPPSLAETMAMGGLLAAIWNFNPLRHR